MHVESAIASLHPLCDRCYDWKKNCINFCLPVGVCTCIWNGPFFRHFITTLYTSNPPPLHPFNKFNKITATIYCFLLENPAVIYTTVDIMDLRCRKTLLHVWVIYIGFQFCDWSFCNFYNWSLWWFNSVAFSYNLWFFSIYLLCSKRSSDLITVWINFIGK